MLASSFARPAAGLALVAVGTFFAQATATGFVGRAATTDRGSASGLYLASYFLGGLSGSAVLGQVFDRIGWPACVAGIGLSLLLGAVLAAAAHPRPPRSQRPRSPHRAETHTKENLMSNCFTQACRRQLWPLPC